MRSITDTKPTEEKQPTEQPTSFVGFDQSGIIVGRITLGIACWKVSYGTKHVRHLWLGRSLEDAERVLRGAGAVEIKEVGA